LPISSDDRFSDELVHFSEDRHMLRTWFRRPARRTSAAKKGSPFRPRLEPLEARRLLSFLPGVSYPNGTGSPAGFVAVADLTGNGVPDIVATNTFQDYRVSVLLGNGDGSFQPAATYLTGDNPVGVRIADVNGDGIPDIITNNVGANTVSVLLGNGDGSFRHKRDYFAGLGGPEDLVVADLNGDGIPDIATANQNAGTVNVLLGNGDGSFQPPVAYAVGAGPVHIEAGLFGNDTGLPDLAVVNNGSGTVSVLVNHGDGTFRRHVDYPVGANPFGITLGDFTNSGTLDIAVANFQSNSVSILPGNGDHTFQRAVNIPVPGGPNDPVAADFNNDGNLDLAVTVQGGGNDRVSILLGDGTGHFAPPMNFPTDSDPLGIAAADLNADGFADLVTASAIGRSVTVLMNDGTWDPGPRGHKTSADVAKRGSPGQALAPLAVSFSELERDTPMALTASLDQPLDAPPSTPCGSASAAPRPWTSSDPALLSPALPGGGPCYFEASDLLESEPGALDRPRNSWGLSGVSHADPFLGP
jgi:hypothetical protein